MLTGEWCCVKQKLRNAKRYLKTSYCEHCKPEEAECPDHCRKFDLSDDSDFDYQEICTHENNLECEDCCNLVDVLDTIERKIQSSSWSSYSNEHCNNLHYDFKQSSSHILQWKAHILRSVNQEIAKQDCLKTITNEPDAALKVMDWAMKFQQLSYREKQSDWYGKRGLSWHISTVISIDPKKKGSLELQSYAHLFDTCQQDWFAVTSIVENTLKVIKKNRKSIKSTCGLTKLAVIIIMH